MDWVSFLASFECFANLSYFRIYPSEITILDIVGIEMSEAELKKANDLMKRPYVNSNLQRELNCFAEQKMKAEIESLYLYSTDFLINDYIPWKISLIEMPI